MLELGEIDRYDGTAAVGRSDGLEVVVAEAASLVGKRLKVRVERVLDGRAYAVLTKKTKATAEPLTAEAEAEKPTRKPPARKGAGAPSSRRPSQRNRTRSSMSDDEPEIVEDVAEDADDEASAAPAKKKTRRGSRGGRNRKKPAATIHLPGDDLGEKKADEPAAEDAAAPEEPAAEERLRNEDTPRSPSRPTATRRRRRRSGRGAGRAAGATARRSLPSRRTATSRG